MPRVTPKTWGTWVLVPAQPPTRPVTQGQSCSPSGLGTQSPGPPYIHSGLQLPQFPPYPVPLPPTSRGRNKPKNMEDRDEALGGGQIPGVARKGAVHLPDSDMGLLCSCVTSGKAPNLSELKSSSREDGKSLKDLVSAEMAMCIRDYLGNRASEGLRWLPRASLLI